MNYFIWGEKIEKFFEANRGNFISMGVDGKDGEKTLNGVICLCKGRWTINEGADASDFDPKGFNVNKIKWIRKDGKTKTATKSAPITGPTLEKNETNQIMGDE